MKKLTRITAIERPDPPADLTPEQAHEWNSVVNRLPADAKKKMVIRTS